MFRKFASLAVFGIFSFCMLADNYYVAVDKNGKVYDDAASKYVTLNERNNEVTIIPGMVFKALDRKPGVVMIEYSPGLRAFIDEKITSPGSQVPSPGTYPVVNNKALQLTAEKVGDGKWTARVGNASYEGILQDNNIIVFYDNSHNAAYSLVDFGSGPIAISYDNNVTHFF